MMARALLMDYIISWLLGAITGWSLHAVALERGWLL